MALLQETIVSLEHMAGLFDAGHRAAAKDMAVKLRVLFYDTPRSVSLLGQLGVKENFRYSNTAQRVDPDNLFPTWGLVYARISTDGAGKITRTYEAFLDNIPPSHLQDHLEFDDWWMVKVIKDNVGNQLCRADIVKILANKEGGAHVDPNLSHEYEHINRQHSLLALGQDENGQIVAFEGSPLEEALRQIVFETLKTFYEQPDIFAAL